LIHIDNDIDKTIEKIFRGNWMLCHWLRSCSGVAIQVASGAYAPPVSKIHNIFGM